MPDAKNWLLTEVGQIGQKGRMPRQPKLSIPVLIHHVMGRGIEGCDIFLGE